MSESSEPKGPFKIKLDGTINAGHVLILTGWMVGIFAWGIRLESQVAIEKAYRERFEVEMVRRFENDDRRERESFAEVRSALRRIEDYILRTQERRSGP